MLRDGVGKKYALIKAADSKTATPMKATLTHLRYEDRAE
jgi:hypothetical protein